ncbi:MAG: FtsX-like permease family protein, partial [Bryobacteraceae bacterium]
AFTADLPLLGAEHLVYEVDGKPPPKNWPLQPPVNFVEVSPNYFKTMRIPLIKGRAFTDRDDNKTTLHDTYFVAIVNQAFARRFLGGQNPIGSLIRPDVSMAPWFHVVGVVRDFHQDRIDQPTGPAVFPCLIQQEETQLAIAARVRGDPLSFVKPIAQMVHDADPSLPVYSPMTMERLMHQQLGWRTFHTSVLMALAGIALLLAAIGIYAVAAYSVAARTAEIGVRMALGAQRSDIVRMVLWSGTMPAICGTFLGAACALALRKVLAGFLYGITATDPPTYAAVIGFLIFVSLAATFIPALRAASIDPSRALRYQ